MKTKAALITGIAGQDYSYLSKYRFFSYFQKIIVQKYGEESSLETKKEWKKGYS